MSASTEDAKSHATNDPKNSDLGLLEEDDEFEEFPAEGERDQESFGHDPSILNASFVFAEWNKDDEDASDANVWEDNWDDDTVEDDFSIQLK